MTIRNAKVLSLALAGVMVAASAVAPLPASAASKNNVRAPKVNVTNFIFNSTGRVVIKDLLRVTKSATFKKNVNVLQDLTVSGATALQGLTVAGDLNAANVKFAGTADVSEMDTDALVGGEVYYDSDEKKLYLWNATEWIDLSEEGGDSSLGDDISSSEIVNDTIVAADIAAGGVGAAELATDAVNSAKIENDTVGAADLAADSVASSELAADSVGASELADDAVVAANIDDATITNAKMVNDTVDFDKIDDTPSLDAATVLALGAFNLDFNLDSTGEFAIQDGGADVLHVADDTGVTTISDDMDLVMGVAENMGIDSATADTTTTAGVLDMDVDAGVADGVDGINIDMEQADGATSGHNATAQEMLLTQNDANGDMFGLTITGAATTNATTGSYEAGISIDNAENTAASMTDAVLIASSGVDAGVTDAIDASAANITNALNIGANTITGTTGVVDFTDFDVSADGALTLAPDDGGVGITLTPSAALTTGIDLNSNNIVTDIEMQNGETIDNNADGTVAVTATTTALSGGATVGTTLGVTGATTLAATTVAGTLAPEAASTRDIGTTSAEFDDIFVADDNGLNLGLGQDAELAYDETGDDRVELTGTGATLFVEDRLALGRQTMTMSSAGAITENLTPTASYVEVAGQDNASDVVQLQAGSAKEGDIVIITNLDATAVALDATSTTKVVGGADVALSQYDVVQLIFDGTNWLQVSPVTTNS